MFDFGPMDFNNIIERLTQSRIEQVIQIGCDECGFVFWKVVCARQIAGSDASTTTSLAGPSDSNNTLSASIFELEREIVISHNHIVRLHYTIIANYALL